MCGLDDGRILRVDPRVGTWQLVAATGGRPLGLELVGKQHLIVCDASRGLLRVDLASGAIETLVSAVAGEPLKFCSNATTDRNGVTWFTQSTTRFDFDSYMGALLEHRPTGRLLRRDPDGRVEVVLRDLHFPNGMTLTTDQRAVLFVETDGYRLNRLAIAGPEAGRHDVLWENMPGFPDNVSKVSNGRLWIAMASPRDPRLDLLGAVPGGLRRGLWRLPPRLRPRPRRTTWVVAVDEQGSLVADLQSSRGDYFMVTGVAEAAGCLYLSSVEHDALLEVDLRDRHGGEAGV